MRFGLSLFVSLMLGAPWVHAEAPAGYAYAAEGSTLWVTAPDGRRHRTALPCSGVATATAGERLYVACGEDGVAVFSLVSASTPQLIGVRDLGGPVVGFHSSSEGVWAELVKREARFLGGPGETATRPEASEVPPRPAAPEAPVASPAPAPGPPSETLPIPLGSPHMVPLPEVVEARGSRVIVTLGRSSGLSLGDHVSLYRTEAVPLGGGESTEERVVLAVGTVVNLGPERSEVELGRNEVVPLGTRAERTTAEVTASRMLPPRPDGVWELAFNARPFLALGSYGFGAVNDLSVGLRMEQGVHLLGLLEPLGFGLAKDGNIFAGAASVLAAYDTRYFEVGLGAGWTSVNSVTPEPRAGGGWNRVDHGFLLAQIARLGAEDGLHLAARNTFILYRGQYNYGGTIGELMLPVSDRAWLVGRGGGGEAGYAFGELGVRMLMRGNGGHDSLFVTATLGGASLEKADTCDPTCASATSYGGPMVGLGLEWRP